MKCQCEAPGPCGVLGKYQSPRAHAICRRDAPAGLTAEQCDVIRGVWFGKAALRGTGDALACPHRGEQTGTKTCQTCGNRGKEVSVYQCHLYGACTLQPYAIGQRETVCAGCAARDSFAPEVLGRKRINPAQLLPNDYQFNNSLIRFAGRLLMAYRLAWSGASIVLAELDEQFNVIGNWRLPLTSGAAQEDPRLFVYRDQLHVSFTAVQRKHGAITTDVCYARLAETGSGWTVAQEWQPSYAGRDPQWEKNWGFFEHGGELLCLYSINTPDMPFRVLRIDGNAVEVIAEHRCDFDHKAGVLHCGAPPVFYRGEYYCFYHRRLGRDHNKTYTIDVLTFEAKPPFRPSRHVIAPLLTPTPSDRPGPAVPHAVFPGGAYIDERHRWVVSSGYYDKWSEIVWFDVNQIETALVPLPGGPMDGIAYRRGTSDLAFVKEVRDWNEYGLPDRFAADDVIVDIGAHIGSFTLACLERGAGRVIAYEPFPPSFDLLAKNVAGQTVEVRQQAVGGSRGTLELRNRDSSGTSFVAVSGYMGGSKLLATAEQITLADALPPGRVRLLKLDCEGAEYDIVKDADLSNVQEIVGEAHAVRWRGKPANIETLAAMLEPRGFAVSWKDNANGTWDFTARRG